jgi:hypothetical protein
MPYYIIVWNVFVYQYMIVWSLYFIYLQVFWEARRYMDIRCVMYDVCHTASGSAVLDSMEPLSLPVYECFGKHVST